MKGRVVRVSICKLMRGQCFSANKLVISWSSYSSATDSIVVQLASMKEEHTNYSVKQAANAQNSLHLESIIQLLLLSSYC